MPAEVNFNFSSDNETDQFTRMENSVSTEVVGENDEFVMVGESLPLLTKQSLRIEDLTFLNIMSHRKTAFAISAVAWSIFNSSFMLTFMTLHLHKHFVVPMNQMGFYQLTVTLPYLIGCLMWPHLFKTLRGAFNSFFVTRSAPLPSC